MTERLNSDVLIRERSKVADCVFHKLALGNVYNAIVKMKWRNHPAPVAMWNCITNLIIKFSSNTVCIFYKVGI